MILKHMKILKKIASGQGYNYTTGCLYHPYFKKIYIYNCGRSK